MNEIIDLIRSYGGGIGVPEDFMNETTFFILLIVTLSGVIASSNKLYRFITLRLKQHQLDKDLAPYFSKLEITLATKDYLPTKYQNVSPSEDEEPGSKYIASAKNLIIPMFLNKAFKNDADDNKIYLILADSGMGKTTFLINLYIAYQNQWVKPYKIRLFPLGSNRALKDIKAINEAEQKDTIILLDAFDEDNEAVKDYKKRMGEILDIVWRFREVVITCRTQFFPSQSEEPHETGYLKFSGDGGEYYFQKLYLSVFDNNDVHKYLRKRFNLCNPINWQKYRQALSITRKSPNLMIRPMLLSNIEDLTAKAQDYQYAYQIYSKLITVWIDREAKKPGIKERYQTSDNFKRLLENFSQNLAVDLYQKRDSRKGLMIQKDEQLEVSGEFQIADIENINQGLSEKERQSRSLLNRNAEGYYKFSHKSILEYFLAKKALDDIVFFRDFIFDGMDAAKSFYTEMFFDKYLRLEMKKVKGTFNTTNNNKYRPISNMTYRESCDVKVLDIANSEFNFIHNIERFIKLKKVRIDSGNCIERMTMTKEEDPTLILVMNDWFKEIDINEYMIADEEQRTRLIYNSSLFKEVVCRVENIKNNSSTLDQYIIGQTIYHLKIRHIDDITNKLFDIRNNIQQSKPDIISISF